MKRVMIVVAVLFAAVLIQLTIVNGLPLPGGGAPDLVLLCVVALGLTSGPQPGLVAGFFAGLALDLAPPASELVGQSALVLCLAGYLAGKMRFTVLRSAVLAVAVAAVAAAAAEALAAALTLALDTPEVTLATVAQVLPSSLAYDVVVSPLVLFAAVRVAVALGATFSSIDDSPALECGGSAAPGALAAAGEGGVPRARIGARSGGSRAAASGRWLVGDVAADAPAVGAIGWLAGPVTSRRARREQARLTAMLTGASPRKGAFWVGGRPAGLVPVAPPPASRPGGLARLRLRAGVAGTAAAWPGSAGHRRPVLASRPVRLGLAEEQRRRTRTAGRRGAMVSRTASGRPEAGLDQHGIDRHGLNGPDVRAIGFRTGEPAGVRPAVRRAVPKISFGVSRQAGSAPSARPAVPKIAFGAGRRPDPSRSARPRVPRIAFGTGGILSSGKARPKATPKIGFGTSGSLAPAARASQGRLAVPKFRTASSRPATGQWLAHLALTRSRSPREGFRSQSFRSQSLRSQSFRSQSLRSRGLGSRGLGSRGLGSRGAGQAWAAVISRPGRRAKGPRFRRGATSYGLRPSRQPKMPRMRAGRWPLRRLPWLRRAGGRSAVWRIEGRREGGYR